MATVDVLILTYRPDLALARCIASVAQLDGVRLLVAINNDPAVVAEAIEPLRAQWASETVTFIDLGRNWGYAEGINRGLAHCSAPYILLLNDDAVMTHGALDTLVQVLDTQPQTIAGVGPKTMLAHPARVIDNLGAGVHASGYICNRGIGELDIGQYDRLGVHPVVGLCFAAALIRLSAFNTVGLLNSSYFMYAEDSEWCLRAKAHGFTFLATPEAVVVHAHSLSTRTQESDFKDWLILRNSFLTVATLLPARVAANFFLRLIRDEIAAYKRNGAAGRLAVHLVDLTRRAPALAFRRVRLQRIVRQRGTAADLLTHEADCTSHNDIGPNGTIIPRANRSTLIAMYERRDAPLDRHVVRLLEHEPADTLNLVLGPLLAPDGPEVVALLRAVVSRERGATVGDLQISPSMDTQERDIDC